MPLISDVRRTDRSVPSAPQCSQLHGGSGGGRQRMVEGGSSISPWAPLPPPAGEQKPSTCSTQQGEESEAGEKRI